MYYLLLLKDDNGCLFWWNCDNFLYWTTPFLKIQFQQHLIVVGLSWKILHPHTCASLQCTGPQIILLELFMCPALLKKRFCSCKQLHFKEFAHLINSENSNIQLYQQSIKITFLNLQTLPQCNCLKLKHYAMKIKIKGVFTPVLLVRLKRTQVRFPSDADLLGRCEYSITLWCAPNKPHRDPAEEVVSVRFQTNSGTVRLRCEYEPASIRPNCRKHSKKHTARAYSAVVCISIA